jgi:hypothetical protein
VPSSAVWAADPAVLKAALVANQASLDAFPTYKCRFTWTKAIAKSEQAALRREYEGATSCDYILVVDGGKEKFQALTPSKIPSPKGAAREKDGKAAVSVDFMPACDLRLREHSLRYIRNFQQATVAKGRPEDPSGPSPLTLICGGAKRAYSPAKNFLSGHTQNPATLTGEGESILEDSPVVHVRAQAKSIDYEYYFDVRRGYWPLKFVQHLEPPWAGEKHDHVIHLVKAQECGRQRWFPMTWVEVSIYPKRSSVLVSELNVTELDVDNKPSDEDFSILLPAGTAIDEDSHAPGQAPRSFRLRQQEKITPDDIPRLAKMLNVVAQQPLMDTAVHSPPPFPWVKWSLFGGGCLALALAVVVYRRREGGTVSRP